MNVVFLSPGATPNYYKFCVALKAMGATVLAIGDEVYDHLHPELKNALTEFYRVNDLHHYPDLVRAMGYLTFKYGKIDWIDSLAEYWLETEAKLRSDFNITGIKTDTIDLIKRKSHMKEIFQKEKINVAKGKVALTVSEAKKFISQTGYPVIAKPDIGVGALNTYKLHNDKELEQLFQKKAATIDYIFEEFIDSEICTFDGLVDQKGQIVFCNSLTYSQGIMETVNDDLDVYYYTALDIPKNLKQIGEKTVQAFQLKGRFFHLEFFKLPKDRYIALEVNMRPPGGFTVDMFNYSADIDLYKAWAEIVVTGHTELPYKRNYHAVYVSRKHNKAYCHSCEAIKHAYQTELMDHISVPGVFSSALGDEGYILRTDSIDNTIKAAEYITAKI